MQDRRRQMKYDVILLSHKKELWGLGNQNTDVDETKVYLREEVSQKEK